MESTKERMEKLRSMGQAPVVTKKSKLEKLRSMGQAPVVIQKSKLEKLRSMGQAPVVTKASQIFTPEEIQARNQMQFLKKIHPSVTPGIKLPSNAAELAALTNPINRKKLTESFYTQWKESRRQETEKKNHREIYGDFDLEMGRRALNSLAKQAQTLRDQESLPYDTAEEWTKLHNQRMDTQKKVSDLSEFLSEAEQYQNQDHWESIQTHPDFREKSQYRSTQKNVSKYDPIAKVSYPTSFDDILYDYINKNEEAIHQMTVSSIADNTAFLGLNQSYLQQMSEDEIATFNYLYATEGKEPAYQYVKNITDDLNARKRESVEKQWAENARENPVFYSISSIAASPFKSLSFLGQVADYASHQKIDPNQGYQKFSYINSAVRDQVNEIVQNKWGPVGSFAYQTGMSMGDFLFHNLITGGNRALSLAIMGSGAAADATIAAKDRGLSDQQAFTLGLVAGAAEIITEKVSIDALFDTIKLGKAPVHYFLKNTLSEGSEEVGSDLINLIAEILVAKDQSQWQMSINAYQEKGMSKRNAFWNSFLDQAKILGLDFLGGAISGGAISGGAIGFHYLGNQSFDPKTGTYLRNLGEDVVQPIMEEGLQSHTPTKPYEMAQSLQNQFHSRKKLTYPEPGRLSQENVWAMEQKFHSENDVGIPESTRESLRKVFNGKRPDSQSYQHNAKSIPDDITRDFGENGAKAFRAGLEAELGFDEYYAGFSAYYQAGMNGFPMGKVDTDYGNRLHPAQKFAAYCAGKNDREVSLKRKQTAAKFAKVAGTDSGLVYDDFVRQAIESRRTVTDKNGETRTYLTEETASKIHRLAKSLGVRVRFVDSVRGGTANAQISGNTILLERDNPNPVMAIVGHEMTHRMQELAPTEYRKFRDKIAWEQQEHLQDKMDSYARCGVFLSQEQAMDELAADYAGRLIHDPQFLDRFMEKYREDKTLLERIRDAIRSMIAKLTGAEKKKAQTAEGKLTAALEAAARQAEALASAAPPGALQETLGAGTMEETHYLAKGNYWRPDLSRAEWDLLNRCMEREIGDSAHTLDRATKWAYVNEKGVQVFALYGVGDGTQATPLYAVGGKKAEAMYNKLMSDMEENKHGLERDETTFSRWIEIIRRNASYDSGNSYVFGRTSGRTKRTHVVYGRPSERYATGTSGMGNRAHGNREHNPGQRGNR